MTVPVRLSVAGGLVDGSLDADAATDSDAVGVAVELGVCDPDGLPVLLLVALGESVPV